MSSPQTRITWTEALEGGNRELCAAEKQVLDEMAGVVDAIGRWDRNDTRSFAKFFRDGFRSGLPDHWLQDFLLVPVNRRKSSAINFVADAVLTFEDCPCGLVHQVRVEISFDNRQIIGTNVLKMLVGTNVGSTENRHYLGVVVCPSKESKTGFDLDASVASADEYLLAIENGYFPFVSVPIFLGVIRAS